MINIRKYLLDVHSENFNLYERVVLVHILLCKSGGYSFICCCDCPIDELSKQALITRRQVVDSVQSLVLKNVINTESYGRTLHISFYTYEEKINSYSIERAENRGDWQHLSITTGDYLYLQKDCVYFARCKDYMKHCIKIGKTKRYVPKRLKDLQRQYNSKPFEAIAIARHKYIDRHELELKIHHLFNKHRVKGEFFGSKPVLDFLGLNKQNTPPK